MEQPQNYRCSPNSVRSFFWHKILKFWKIPFWGFDECRFGPNLRKSEIWKICAQKNFEPNWDFDVDFMRFLLVFICSLAVRMGNTHFRAILLLRGPEIEGANSIPKTKQNEHFWWWAEFRPTLADLGCSSASTAEKRVFPIYPAKIHIKTRRKIIKLMPYSKFGSKFFLAQNFQILDFLKYLPDQVSSKL